MKANLRITEPTEVGEIQEFRLCCYPSNMEIMRTRDFNKVIEHCRWLVEHGVTHDRFVVYEVEGREFKRDIDVSVLL